MLEILEEIPRELLSYLKVLSNKYALAIVLMLLKIGEMSYSEICRHSQLHRKVIDDCLTMLTQSALVHQYYKKKEGNQEYRFYELSVSGRQLIKKLLDSVT